MVLVEYKKYDLEDGRKEKKGKNYEDCAEVEVKK
jgi:hypothetical protein